MNAGVTKKTQLYLSDFLRAVFALLYALTVTFRPMQTQYTLCNYIT